eukprot:ANDGO_06675.mRNA.1 hypothetical protein
MSNIASLDRTIKDLWARRERVAKEVVRDEDELCTVNREIAQLRERMDALRKKAVVREALHSKMVDTQKRSIAEFKQINQDSMELKHNANFKSVKSMGSFIDSQRDGRAVALTPRLTSRAKDQMGSTFNMTASRSAQAHRHDDHDLSMAGSATVSSASTSRLNVGSSSRADSANSTPRNTHKTSQERLFTPRMTTPRKS